MSNNGPEKYVVDMKPRKKSQPVFIKKENYNTCKSLSCPSHPPTTTDSQTNGKVLHALRNNCWEPYGKIADCLGDVNEHQVKQITYNASYQRYLACQKPFITTKALQEQQEWAIQNEGWNWSNDVWTDEASIK
jgi:hypothetical protein